MDPDWQENNLDHVLELIDWANELATRFPQLKHELSDGKEENWVDFQAMLVLHDIGEIAVGDICRSDPRFDQKYGRLHKRKEAYAAHLMLSTDLVGENSAKLRALYNRFGRKDQDDRLVMLGNLFDKGQATQNVARHQVRFNMDDQEYLPAKSATKNISLTLDYMIKAMTRLPSTELKQNLATFTSEKVLSAFDELKIFEVDEVLRDIRRQFAQACINL